MELYCWNDEVINETTKVGDDWICDVCGEIKVVGNVDDMV